jgi:hypothetical protein
VARPPQAIAGRAEALRGSAQARACRGSTAHRRRRPYRPGFGRVRPSSALIWEEGPRDEIEAFFRVLSAKVMTHMNSTIRPWYNL